MSEETKLHDVAIENVKLLFKNFSGEAGKYNTAGNRNFNILLTDEEAKDLTKQGYNIKTLEPRDPADQPQYILKVKANYSHTGRDPKVVMINSHGKTLLHEDNVNLLDVADIKNADIVISPYEWEVNGNKGISAYLKSLYVTIQEDPFEEKYFDGPDVPDSFNNTIEFQAVKKDE